MKRGFILLLLFTISAKADETHQGSQPPQAVVTTIVKSGKLSQHVIGVGTFTAYNDVTLKAETSGRIAGVHFKEGDRAKENQILFTLRNQEQKAQLKKAEAALNLSKNILKRKEGLFAKDFISKQDLENAQAKVKIDAAELALAQEALAKTFIQAPFDGVLSHRTSCKGAYVDVGSELVRIQDLTPLRFTFDIPQREIPLLKVGDKVIATTDVFPQEKFEGVIDGIEPSVREKTRSMTIYATFPNRQEKLIPGLYGQVKISSGKEDSLLLIPEQALVIRPSGNFVYKNVDKKAVLTPVTLGRRSDDQAEIKSGLCAGDEIVLEGQDKLQDGSPLTVGKKI